MWHNWTASVAGRERNEPDPSDRCIERHAFPGFALEVSPGRASAMSASGQDSQNRDS